MSPISRPFTHPSKNRHLCLAAPYWLTAELLHWSFCDVFCNVSLCLMNLSGDFTRQQICYHQARRYPYTKGIAALDNSDTPKQAHLSSFIHRPKVTPAEHWQARLADTVLCGSGYRAVFAKPVGQEQSVPKPCLYNTPTPPMTAPV